MKSASIGTLMSVVSLAGVGILYLKVDDLSDQVRPLTKGRAERHAVNDLPDDPVERDAPARAVLDEGQGNASEGNRNRSDQIPLSDARCCSPPSVHPPSKADAPACGMRAGREGDLFSDTASENGSPHRCSPLLEASVSKWWGGR